MEKLGIAAQTGLRTGTQAAAFAPAGKAIGILTLVAAALRLFLLGHKSFWFDEAASYRFCRFTPAAFKALLWQHELNMSAYYVLLRGWLHLGTSEFVIRLLSVLFAVATIPVFYAVGARLLPRRTALLATGLLAVNATHVAYSQEARGYSLAVFLCTLSCLFFVRLLGYRAEQLTATVPVDEVSRAKISGVTGNCVLYVLFSAAAVYAHFFAVLAIAAQWLALVAYPRRIPWCRLLLCGFFMAVLLLPAAWFVLTRNSGQLDWVPPLSALMVLKVITMLSGHAVAVVIYVPLWIVAVRHAICLQRRERQLSPANQIRVSRGSAGGSTTSSTLACCDTAWPFWFLLSWAVLPFLISAAISLSRPVVHPRFLIVSLPAAVLLGAAGIDALGKRRRVALMAAVVLSFAGVVHYYTLSKEDWRGASHYVLTNSAPGDAILFMPEYVDGPYDYYQQQARKDSTRPAFERAAQFAAAAASRAWLVVYDPQRVDSYREAEMRKIDAAFEGRYSVVSRRQFKKIDVVLYEKNSRTTDP